MRAIRREALLDDKAGAQILGFGPIMARSLTVLAMASLPISPPKKSGETVKLSVVKATGPLPAAGRHLHRAAGSVAKVAKEELIDRLVHLHAASAATVAKIADFSHRSGTDPHISVVSIAGPSELTMQLPMGWSGCSPGQRRCTGSVCQAAQDIGALARLVVIDGV